MKKLKKPAVLCAIVLIMALLLCGCMKMHIDVVWNEDNSASIAMTVGVTKSALTMMEVSEEEIQAQLREGMEGGEDFTFESFSDSEYAGIIATLKVDDITKNSAGSIDQLNFTSVEEGDKKTYTVSGNLENSNITGGNSELEGIDIDIKMSIVMPGRILSNNASEKQGNKLTWVMTDSSASSIQATSESGPGSGGGGLLWLWIVIGIVVLAGIVLVVLILSRRKKA